MTLTHDDYVGHDATALAALVRRGEVSADELLDAALARLEETNERLGAVIAVHRDRARGRIAAGVSGAFAGVPFLLKDLFTDLAGTVGWNGSAFHLEAPATVSSTVVERWEAAGLVIFGRTHSPEFGGTSTSESRLFGVTRNPWNLGRIAGGSSGGSAAAVAAGVVPAAQATDAGGSIVIPAAFCGLFGLKPTRGRVPLGPSRLEGAGGLAVQHAVTRSVRDSAALLDVECAGELIDGLAPPLPERGFAARLDRPTPRLRIALVRRSVHGITPAPEVADVVDAAARLCLTLGHHVEEADLPVAAEDHAAAERVLRLASIAATVTGLERRIGRSIRQADLEPATWARHRAGLAIAGTQILEARETMMASALAMQRFFARHDLVLSPAVCDPPSVPGRIDLSRTDEAAAALNLRHTTWAGIFNWTGLPAMTVPLGATVEGLPVGVLFAARHGAEETLLRFAAELERARPWTGLAPMDRGGPGRHE